MYKRTKLFKRKISYISVMLHVVWRIPIIILLDDLVDDNAILLDDNGYPQKVWVQKPGRAVALRRSFFRVLGCHDWCPFTTLSRKQLPVISWISSLLGSPAGISSMTFRLCWETQHRQVVPSWRSWTMCALRVGCRHYHKTREEHVRKQTKADMVTNSPHFLGFILSVDTDLLWELSSKLFIK